MARLTLNAIPSLAIVTQVIDANDDGDKIREEYAVLACRTSLLAFYNGRVDAGTALFKPGVSGLPSTDIFSVSDTRTSPEKRRALLV